MKHADLVIQRILVPRGCAQPGRLRPDPRRRHAEGAARNDLALEHAALAVLRPGIALCLEIGDHGTRDLLERILVDEEHHVDWIEAQEHKIAEVGYQQYLAQ